MKIHVSNPDGEGGVLLEQSLSAVDVFAQLMSDGATDGELDETEHERQQGDEQQEGVAGLTV